MMRKPKSVSFNIVPEYPCKFNFNKNCYNIEHPDCENCSKNPHRFDNRKITKRQIIALVKLGHKEEDVCNWSYLDASKELSKYKQI